MKSKAWRILFAIAVAFVLWLYVITVVSPESSEDYSNVTVTLESETVLSDKGLMLLPDTVPTIKVMLEGNRSDLVNIYSSDLTAVADLSKISEPGTHQLPVTVAAPGAATSVTVQDYQPKTVTVVVAERLSKKVPVVVQYTGSVPEGYLMDKGNEVLSYEEVSISGPREVVDQIQQAVLEIDCEGKTETIVEEQRFKLCDADGNPLDVSLVETEVETIRLEVRVSSVKKIPLVLTVNDGGGATEENSSIVIDPAEITVSGNSAVLDELTELNLGTINLAEITDDTQREFEIVMPEGVRNESGVTTAVVTISFPELSKKEFTITNIRTIHVAEGMAAELLTKQLTITVRGPKKQVGKLTVEDIAVVLDLTDVVNTDSLVPSITFGEDFPDVGVVGKYTVSVTVSEAVPDETGEG